MIKKVSFGEKLSDFRDTILLLAAVLLVAIGGFVMCLFQDIYVGACYVLGFSLRRKEKPEWTALLPVGLWSAVLGIFLIICLVAGIFWRVAFYLAPIGILIAAVGSFPKHINYHYRRKKQQEERQAEQS